MERLRHLPLPGSLLVAGMLVFPRLGYSQTEEITIHGQRSKDESERSARTGQSQLIQPHESSRFDIATQLKRESSLTFAETGRISPSGFVIPKIRGQDSKLTDLYLEDTLLQDPYSGMPLIDDLDLRAFGSLELHQGISPVTVPNLNPIGTLRYRLSHEAKSRSSIGLSIGSPYGNSLWSLMIHKKEKRELRLYARTHQTTGHYRYYSDESTPYNSRDDKFKIRTNNDQRSQQIIPVYRESWGPYSLQALAWIHKTERGIASGSMILDSAAREKNQGFLGDIALERVWAGLPFAETVQLDIHLAHTDDKRNTIDPQRIVLNSARRSTMEVISDRQGAHLKADLERTRILLSYEKSVSKIDQTYEENVGTGLTRSNGVGIVGLAFTPWDRLLVEFKHSEQRQSDQTDERTKIILEEEADQAKAHKSSRADAVSFAFGDFNNGIYGQFARSGRLPSLLEEFGNGSELRPNNTLKPELLFHREAGAFTKALGLDLGIAAYLDQTGEKIVFVPILANASKALNVAKTNINGYDASIGWHGANARLSLKGSNLEAYDTSRAQKKILPGIPVHLVVAEWRQQWTETSSTYFTGRYRSAIFRDQGNSLKLPGSVIFDMNFDHSYKNYEIGLAVKNLSDITNVAIDSGPSKGRTGLSDYAGSPLPGRQWVLSLVYNTEETAP